MATTATGRSTPAHLWIVGILATIWNAMGCYDYFMSETDNEKYLSMYGASAQDMIAYLGSFPGWAIAGWALGVWGALAGSLLLLARSRLAVLAYALSLIGLLALTVYQYGMSHPIAAMQTTAMTVMEAAIWAVAIFLLWYAWTMHKKGVLR
jgi:hypothetical protein